eukprot:m.365947 g.365947  ORF g.365947 m.365947 type:complete len:1069 (-) comp33986_c0_seq1:174-3380(-)
MPLSAVSAVDKTREPNYYQRVCTMQSWHQTKGGAAEKSTYSHKDGATRSQKAFTKRSTSYSQDDDSDDYDSSDLSDSDAASSPVALQPLPHVHGIASRDGANDEGALSVGASDTDSDEGALVRPSQEQLQSAGMLVDTVAENHLQTTESIQGIRSAPALSIQEACAMAKEAFEELQEWNVELSLDLAKRHVDSLKALGKLSPLSTSEGIALHIYTQQTPLFGVLNSALRTRQRIEPVAPFLRIFLHGVCKLEPYSGHVFRGVKADLRDTYKPGSQVVWWAFSSTTDKIQVLKSKQFLGKHGKRTLFSLTLHHNAVDISRFSAIGTEAERLVLPGTRFAVTGQGEFAKGIAIIQLSECGHIAIDGFELKQRSPPIPEASSASRTEEQFKSGKRHLFAQDDRKDVELAQMYFRSAAESGHPHAQFYLGRILFLGLGYKCDRKEAAIWFSQAVEGGSINARGWLALMYYKGLGGLNRSEEKAIQLLQPSISHWKRQADKHSPEACLRFGWCLQNGLCVPKQLAAAVRHFRNAADKNDSDAQYQLALCYKKEQGVKAVAGRNPSREAFRLFRLAAAQGHVNALVQLGNCYEKGVGTHPSVSLAASCYRKSAVQGLPEAQYKMGMLHMQGVGVEQSMRHAAMFFEQAVAGGNNPAAMFELAKLYDVGEGVKHKDSAKATQLLEQAAELNHKGAMRALIQRIKTRHMTPSHRKTVTALVCRAAKQDDPMAQCYLGSCYERGNGVDKDLKRALECYRSAAQCGHAHAQYKLGRCYKCGIGVKANLKQAIRLFQSAAGKESAAANHRLGRCHEKGEGVPRNPKVAVAYYKAAMEQRHPKAIYRLALCYQHGSGVAQNLSTAASLFKQAAFRRHAKAQVKYALCCLNGEGVEADPSQAREWAVFAARQRDAHGQFLLARFFRDGIGGEKNETLALHNYSAAADQGHLKAQLMLGDLYRRGYGGRKDANKAAHFYKLAAEQGHPRAEHNLARCYKYGIGVRRNSQLAIDWFERAAEQGHEDAAFKAAQLRQRQLALDLDACVDHCGEPGMDSSGCDASMATFQTASMAPNAEQASKDC